METLEKYSWLKQINKALLSLDEIPLLRGYAPFNFDEFSEKLEKKLQDAVKNMSDLFMAELDKAKNELKDFVEKQVVESEKRRQAFIKKEIAESEKRHNKECDKKGKL